MLRGSMYSSPCSSASTPGVNASSVSICRSRRCASPGVCVTAPQPRDQPLLEGLFGRLEKEDVGDAAGEGEELRDGLRGDGGDAVDGGESVHATWGFDEVYTR